MSHAGRGMWLTGLAFLAVVASPELVAQYAKAPDAKAPDAYSVTEVNNMFMPGMTMEITRDGTRAVVDQSYPPREAVRAGSMEPMTTGFQVAVDLTVDLDHPASYKMGAGPGGKATFAGGGLKDLTSQLRNGVLRIDNAPEKFDVETAYSTGEFNGVLIYRQCFGPQTVLLHVVNDPAKLSDGGYWLWVKSGKYAKLPN